LDETEEFTLGGDINLISGAINYYFSGDVFSLTGKGSNANVDLAIIDLMSQEASGSKSIGIGTGVTLGLSAGLTEGISYFTWDDITKINNTYKEAIEYSKSGKAGFSNPEEVEYYFFAYPDEKSGGREINVSVSGSINIDGKEVEQNTYFSTGVTLFDEVKDDTKIIKSNSTKE